MVGRNLPTEGWPPNGCLIKRDPQGDISRCSYYDADGIATKRVDLTGKPHYDKATGMDIPTPHVVDIVGNVDPKTGKVYASTDSSSTRPALPGEIP
ncbi:polymorphic toxin type 24 domain-containing protein [Nocardia otitidiscaviarum]|uniref:polymorphic toxin type 24 domain-containing protein n=1 Tax=Nocardia otitidiscaviarum TaxID=1823 RepID=UPI00163DE31F